MKTFFLNFAALILLSDLAFAQVSNSPSSNTPTMTPPKVWVKKEVDGKTYLYRNPPLDSKTNSTPTPLRMEIIELDASRPYFHWAPQDDADRWTSSNGTGLSEAEFSTLRSNSLGQRAGGGFYISKSFTNSANFGSNCVSIKLQKQLKIVVGNISNFFPEADSGVDTQWTADLLQSQGFDGFAYSNLESPDTWWINLFKRNDILSIKPASYDDFLAVTAEKSESIFTWLPLILKYDLEPRLNLNIHLIQLRAQAPRIARLIEGQFTASDRDSFWKEITENNLLDSTIDMFDKSLSGRGTQGEFFNTVLESLNRRSANVGILDNLQTQFVEVLSEKLKDPSFRASYIKDISVYFRLLRVVPASKLGPYLATAMSPRFLGLTLGFTFGDIVKIDSTRLTNDFLTRYFRSFAFIDLADRLAAQAAGNHAIWTLYDTENSKLYENWYQYRLEFAQLEAEKQNTSIQQAYLQAGTNLGPPPTYTAEQLLFNPSGEYYKVKDSLESVTTIASRLSSGKVHEIRGEPVVGGGDYVVNDIHYYRITREELNNLKANPYLSVESIEDPKEKPGSNWVLARHEYPSARTYQRFKSKLSTALQADLITADHSGFLKNTHSETFQKLTKRVILELWNDQKKHTNPLTVYKTGISIHPFPDGNGRTMRFLFSLGAGKPLLLRNWDWDIFLSDSELAYEAFVGKLFFGVLAEELYQIYQTDPNFPKVYDAKSPYAFFFDNGNLNHVADQGYLDQAKAFFQNPKVAQRVRQKLILESGNLESDSCSLLMGGLLKD